MIVLPLFLQYHMAPPTRSGTVSSRQQLAANIAKEDPEKLFEIIEVIGTGSYGEVVKVRCWNNIRTEVQFRDV